MWRILSNRGAIASSVRSAPSANCRQCLAITSYRRLVPGRRHRRRAVGTSLRFQGSALIEITSSPSRFISDIGKQPAIGESVARVVRRRCSEGPSANHFLTEMDMSNWLHSLPVLWMAILVFGFTYLVTAGIYAVVTVFAVGERARSFKAVSPGLLSPLGVIFGLFLVFTAEQVWTDNEKARAEIDREASALRSAVILATSFPSEIQGQLSELVRRYIADVVAQEWPLMA